MEVASAFLVRAANEAVPLLEILRNQKRLALKVDNVDLMGVEAGLYKL